MNTIGDLLARDLSRKIEEIIQVDQADPQSVLAEITEYVATDSIRDQYHDLLKAIAEAPNDPNESVTDAARTAIDAKVDFYSGDETCPEFVVPAWVVPSSTPDSVGELAALGERLSGRC